MPAPDKGTVLSGLTVREFLRLPAERLIAIGLMTMLGLDGWTRSKDSEAEAKAATAVLEQLAGIKESVADLGRNFAIWSTKQEAYERRTDAEITEVKRRLEALEQRSPYLRRLP